MRLVWVCPVGSRALLLDDVLGDDWKVAADEMIPADAVGCD